jgi:outer membrane immunogenic protein
MGGAFGGFNMQNGSFVYGAEADINYSRVDGEATTFDSRSTVDGSLRARAGVTVTEDILLYGTAGVAAERQRITDVATGDRDTNVALGYTVGAGVDAKLTDQVFGRLEYRYTDYGGKDYALPAPNGAEFDSSNHRVSVGLGVKF